MENEELLHDLEMRVRNIGNFNIAQNKRLRDIEAKIEEMQKEQDRTKKALLEFFKGLENGIEGK